MKHCNKCNTDKPLLSFNKFKHSPDGHSSVCKECRKVYYEKGYVENKRHAERMKRYRDKKKLENAPPPEIDVILHAASVRAANELNSISAHKELNTAEVGRMKSLIDILLLIRKNARPRKEDGEGQISTEDLFD